MPVKKTTNANTIVQPEVVDFNLIISSIIKNHQKLARDLTHARLRIVELEAQLSSLDEKKEPITI
jgi:hypothetical protein